MARQVRLGGHLKTEDGLSFVTAVARSLDYDEVQVMLGGPRDYTPIDFEEKSVMEFRKNAFGLGINVHLPYIINPCESVARRRTFYKKVFLDYVETAKAIGAVRLVLHPGFKKTLPIEEAEENLVRFIADVWEPEGVSLLLETDAGSKNESAVGSPGLIKRVIEKLDSEGVAMCIDTEHLYARGISLWRDDTRKKFLSLYKNHIELVHLNSPDPGVKLGSNRDRHNTSFEDRPDLDPESMIKDLSRYPMILERRSYGSRSRTTST